MKVHTKFIHIILVSNRKKTAHLVEQSTPMLTTFDEFKSLFLKRDQLLADTAWNVFSLDKATLSA